MAVGSSNADVIAELKAHTSALEAIGAHLNDQGKVLGAVASSLEIVLERQQHGTSSASPRAQTNGNSQVVNAVGFLLTVMTLLCGGLYNMQVTTAQTNDKMSAQRAFHASEMADVRYQNTTERFTSQASWIGTIAKGLQKLEDTHPKNPHPIE